MRESIARGRNFWESGYDPDQGHVRRMGRGERRARRVKGSLKGPATKMDGLSREV